MNQQWPVPQLGNDVVQTGVWHLSLPIFTGLGSSEMHMEKGCSGRPLTSRRFLLKSPTNMNWCLLYSSYLTFTSLPQNVFIILSYNFLRREIFLFYFYFFSKNKNISAIDFQVTSYQGLHLSPRCFSWPQSDPKCYLGGKELRAVSGCSHSQTSAHPNSIPGVHCTSSPHSNTRGQQGRKPKVFLRHLQLVWIIREPFGCMGGIHTFFLGERQLGLHTDIWKENTAGKTMFSSSLGLCLHLSCL